MNYWSRGLWLAASLILVGGLVAGQMEPGAGAFMESMSSSMKRMDRDMASAPMSGAVDRDFAVMMIPHHQGAIDMAKAELKYGKDPVMLRLAQEIIVDQQSEIEAMRLRLTKTDAMNKKGRQ